MARESIAIGKDIPDMLAGVVASYLKDAPYPGAIRALVNSGWNYRTYLILLKNDFLDVYRHACHADRAEVQEMTSPARTRVMRSIGVPGRLFGNGPRRVPRGSSGGMHACRKIPGDVP